jgi:hypothetical protein
MKISAVIFVSLACAFSARGQKMDTTLRLSVQAGLGWTHYNNNLVIGHSSIKDNFLGGSLRVMWEPEHRLSIGIETGYYQLYNVTLEPGDVGNAELAVIPLIANIRMKIVKGLYITGGTGVAFLRSSVHTPGNPVTQSTVISYSDAQVSLLYLFKITEQFAIGSEVKFMWIDKTNDSFYSLQAVASYRF